MIRILSAPAGLVACALSFAEASAQTNPAIPPGTDPGLINEELRRRQLEQPSGTPDVTAPLAVEPPSTEISGLPEFSVAVRDLQFDQSRYLSPAELEALAATYRNRVVRFSGLQAVVAWINRRYAKLGVGTARAVLPPQQIEDGIIRIRLIEGVIGEVRALGGSPTSRAAAIDRIDLEKGRLADARLVDARLQRFNRLNDTQIRASVEPGVAFGQSDIVLSLIEPKRLQIDIAADNNGYRSTGAYQSSLFGRLYRLLTPQDRLAGAVTVSEGVTTGSASYSLPVGHVRLGVSYARGSTNVIAGPFAALDVRGTSDTYALNAATVLAAGRGVALIGQLTGQVTDTRTRLAGVPISDARVRILEAGSTLSISQEGFVTNFQNSLLLTETEERLQQSDRGAVVYRGALALQQLLGPGWRLGVQSEWQLSTQPSLAGVLQFQAGGSRSNRAFTPGTIAGDRGIFGVVEIGRTFNMSGLQIEPIVFADVATARSSFGFQQLASLGTGLSISLPRRLNASVSYARALTRPQADIDRDLVLASVTISY